jgi:hypothetical protein
MTLQREGSKVWIEGVPTLQWGTDRECTFAGALEAALAVTEHPFKYTDIMGHTALAFRVRWYKGRTGQTWCPSSPCGEFPDEIAAVQKASGWRLRIEERLDRDEPKMDDFTADIIASIDSGLPVLGYEPGLNAGVIYGYEDQGKTLLMRDYMTRDSDTLRIEPAKLGGMLMLLGDRTDPLPKREAVIAGLKMAVQNARRAPVPAPKGEYHYGEAALMEWANDLGDVSGLSKEDRSNLFFVSWWNFDSLCDARHAAVLFLQDAAAVPGGDAGGALERAAALYRQEAELLCSVFPGKDAFLGPWSGKSESDWTDEVRAREREILSSALALESPAITEIEKALAALGQ